MGMNIPLQGKIVQGEQVGQNLAALQERSLHKTNETDCQSVKGKAHAECANMNYIFENLDKVGHANRQNSFTVDLCLEGGSVHQQDVLEDTKTISRVGALNIYSHRSMDWYIQRQVQGLLKGMKQASGVKTTVAITCTFSTFSTDSYAE
jgi:hypothetical protein